MEGRNGCVFCAHEDGTKCLKFNKYITGNESNANAEWFIESKKDEGYNGVVYLQQDYCSGFQLLEGMKENWESQFS